MPFSEHRNAIQLPATLFPLLMSPGSSCPSNALWFFLPQAFKVLLRHVETKVPLFLAHSSSPHLLLCYHFRDSASLWKALVNEYLHDLYIVKFKQYLNYIMSYTNPYSFICTFSCAESLWQEATCFNIFLTPSGTKQWWRPRGGSFLINNYIQKHRNQSLKISAFTHANHALC